MTKEHFSIYELLNEISPRLGMYIGEQTVDKLGCYIWGYKGAMVDAGIQESPVLDFQKFTRWLRKKYGYPHSAEVAGCEKTILAVSLGISPEEMDQDMFWLNFPPHLTNEQHVESVRLYVSLINEYGKLENAALPGGQH
jgi:hypothetical protein